MFSTILALALGANLASSRTFTVYNACPFTVWPAVYTDPSKGSAVPVGATGWEAPTNSSQTILVPDNWAAGRIWGRRACDFSTVQGPNSCLTGGCEGGLNCTQAGVQPATLAEWTLSPTPDAFDYYDVSLVDGFDLPMRITNDKGCPVAECPVDLISGCPDALKGPVDPSGNVVGCKTSCFANVDGNPGNSTNCCSGAFNTAEKCPSSNVAYYDYFKGRCPNSWAYTFDESSGNALKTCIGSSQADYTLTFCPP